MIIALTNINRMLFTGVLVSVVSIAGPVSAATDSDTIDGLLVAAASFKGEHPGTTHPAYENSKGDIQSEAVTVNTRVNMRGSPPYSRHLMHNKQLEKVQFARFEETSVVSEKQRNPIYRGSQGLRPPYKRN